MQFESFFWSHWYYFGPVYILSALFWTLMGRFILQFFFKDESSNYIYRAFVKVTAPLYKIFRYVTPPFLHHLFYPLYYGFLLILLRMLFHAVMVHLGLAPTLVGVVDVPQP